MNWRQFVRISINRDNPPKDREFIIFETEKIPQTDVLYKKSRSGEFVDKIEIVKKRERIQWVGLAVWDENRKMYSIQSSSFSGLMSIRELSESMFFMDMPQNSSFMHKNHKQQIKPVQMVKEGLLNWTVRNPDFEVIMQGFFKWQCKRFCTANDYTIFER